MNAYIDGIRNNFWGVYSTQPLGQFADLRKIEENCVSIEKGLNLCGYIPFLSTATGKARALYAIVQVVAGVALAIFKSSAAVAETTDADTKARLWTEAGIGVIYAVHGIGNAVRAFFEMIPLINLVCLGYDLTGMRLRYAIEGMPQVQQQTAQPGQTPQAYQVQFPFQIPNVQVQLPQVQLPFQFNWPWTTTQRA